MEKGILFDEKENLNKISNNTTKNVNSNPFTKNN
jgi:hypothetical protein